MNTRIAATGDEPTQVARSGCKHLNKISGELRQNGNELPLVSVIVPCRNEVRHIATFLECMLRQERPFKIEILIADGLSDDGTRDIIHRYSEKHPEVRVLDNPDRVVSAALNAAIKASKGEIIIRADVHTEYASDYLLKCVDVLERTNADNVGGPWIARGDGFLSTVIATAFQSPFCVGGAHGHDPNYEGIVDTVYLGCWRRGIFDRIGLFDSTLVRNQDDELNLRLTRCGGKVWQSAKIRSWYRPRSSLSALFRQYSQYGFWKVRVIRKHGTPASWRHLVPACFVLTNIFLPMLSIAALFMNCSLAACAAVYAWLAMTVLYLVGCLWAALGVLRRYGWKIAVCIPLVIGVYHFAYGIGFVLGLVSASVGAGEQAGPMFTQLTR